MNARCYCNQKKHLNHKIFNLQAKRFLLKLENLHFDCLKVYHIRFDNYITKNKIFNSKRLFYFEIFPKYVIHVSKIYWDVWKITGTIMCIFYFFIW